MVITRTLLVVIIILRNKDMAAMPWNRQCRTIHSEVYRYSMIQSLRYRSFIIDRNEISFSLL